MKASVTPLPVLERDRDGAFEDELPEELALPHVEGEEQRKYMRSGVWQRTIPAVDGVACSRGRSRLAKSEISSLAESPRRLTSLWPLSAIST